LSRLASCGGDGNGFGFRVEARSGADDEFEGARWVFLESRFDISENLGKRN
jgi:hypothetical protein